jgi:hypothetical protein
MESCGIMLITVETELIHTINGLDCLFEFPEIQFAFSCYLCSLLFVFFQLHINQISDL